MGATGNVDGHEYDAGLLPHRVFDEFGVVVDRLRDYLLVYGQCAARDGEENFAYVAQIFKRVQTAFLFLWQSVHSLEAVLIRCR